MSDLHKKFLVGLADLMEECNVTSIVAVGVPGEGAHLEIDIHDGYSPMEPIRFEGDNIHPFEFRNKGGQE
jgi:hypothetical protein